MAVKGKERSEKRRREKRLTVEELIRERDETKRKAGEADKRRRKRMLEKHLQYRQESQVRLQRNRLQQEAKKRDKLAELRNANRVQFNGKFAESADAVDDHREGPAVTKLPPRESRVVQVRGRGAGQFDNPIESATLGGLQLAKWEKHINTHGIVFFHNPKLKVSRWTPPPRAIIEDMTSAEMASGENALQKRATIRIGDKIEAKCAGWDKYFPGTIARVQPGFVDIRFNDGDRKRHVRVEHVRFADTKQLLHVVQAKMSGSTDNMLEMDIFASHPAWGAIAAKELKQVGLEVAAARAAPGPMRPSRQNPGSVSSPRARRNKAIV